MCYESVNFNIDVVKAIPLEQFINHKSYQHLWPKLSDEDRKKRLTELYQLICAL